MCLQISNHETHEDQGINTWEFSYPIQNNLHHCHHMYMFLLSSGRAKTALGEQGEN